MVSDSRYVQKVSKITEELEGLKKSERHVLQFPLCTQIVIISRSVGVPGSSEVI